MKAVAAAIIFAAVAVGADEDPVAVLVRVRDRVLAHAKSIPNYTCVETIERDWYEYAAGPAPRSCDALLGRRKAAGPDKLLRKATTDRIRLDVGLSSVHEIFSWPGAGKFEEGDIDELVPSGAIGTGSFAVSLLGIFEAPDPRFGYQGEKVVGGRRVFEYSFEMPESQSHYQVKAAGRWLITGYDGTLLVDAVTAELVELHLRTAETPAATNACEIRTSLHYDTVRLADREYILPDVVRERFINQNGSEAENATTFASCREFRGESTVRFGEREVESSKPASAAPLDLPAGLAVKVQMTSKIAVDHAAAGDAITGRLAEPILDAAKKNVVIPQGAVLAGRLMRVETRYGKSDELGIALRWDTMEVDGVQRAISLLPDLRTARAVFALPRQNEDRYAAYRFPGAHGEIEALISVWNTAKP